MIATPIVMNVINDSKEGSAKDSMYGYVKAVELATVNTVTATTDAPDGIYKASGGNLVMDTETLKVNFKGSKPKDNGYVSILNGQVVESGLEFDGYCIKYDGSKADVSKDCSVPTPAPAKAYTEGDIIYYNPETNKECTAGEVNTTANAKTGCLKWNVITVGDTTSKATVDIMLDHNSTGKVAWNSSGNNADGMKEVAIALQTNVTTWSESIKSTARLITGQEISNIEGNNKWTSNDDFGTSLAAKPWIYQNTKNNGDDTTGGYWTSTPHMTTMGYSWAMGFVGNLGRTSVSSASYNGVRPVITISKSVIS